MRFVVPLTTLLLAGACTGTPSQDDLTFSGFVTPTNGTINAGLTQATTNGLIDAEGEGFLFQTGVRDGEGLEAVVGLLPGTDTTFRPSEGLATYTGEYMIGTVTDIALSEGFISGIPGETRGRLDLQVDFGSGAVTGSSGNGQLSLSGGLNGRTLEGTVRFQGVPGPLSGNVGGDQAFGVFHGNSADLIYAGGFIAERD